jgi:putative spermidine/putrescine transport system permease protein
MIAEFISLNVLDVPRWGVAATCATVLVAITFGLLALLSRFVGLERAFGAK